MQSGMDEQRELRQTRVSRLPRARPVLHGRDSGETMTRAYISGNVPADIAEHWSDALEQYNPCADALAWARTQPSAAVAWRDCTRGDWMLWLAGQLSGPPERASRKALVLAPCARARLALPHVQDRKS